MIYQSTTGISAGTNKRKMRNLMPPAGLAGPVPLVIYNWMKIRPNESNIIFNGMKIEPSESNFIPNGKKIGPTESNILFI